MKPKARKPKARGNGQGSAYKRGNTWEACVTLRMVCPDDPEKKPYPLKRRKGGFKAKKDALAYCPILLAGGEMKPTAAPRMAEYWEQYKNGEYQQLSASKQCAYKTAWNKLKPLHDMRMDSITVGMLRAAVSEACPSYYTAKDCKAVLTNLFTLAAADHFADKSLPSFIVLPPLIEKEAVPFNETEQASLWKLYESGNRDAAIPLLMIYTGMMPGEAQNLNVSNISLETRTITHAGIKTKIRKQTPIVLASAIIPVVEDLISTALPNGHIWPHDEKAWYDRYYAALEAANCRRLPPYSCRHTTATALSVTENIAPQIIRRVMRWSTAKMLDRYAHPDTSDAISAVNQIAPK